MPPFTGDRPTLPELQHFPTKDGFKDIVGEIANDYQNFGILLLNDEMGNRIRSIERTQQNPVDITVDILRQWLQGSGRLPVTWQILVECLREEKLNTAAGYIVDALLQKGRELFSFREVLPLSRNQQFDLFSFHHDFSTHAILSTKHL